MQDALVEGASEIRLKSQCFDIGLIVWKIYAGKVMRGLDLKYHLRDISLRNKCPQKKTSPTTRQDPNCKDNLPLQIREVIEH